MGPSGEEAARAQVAYLKIPFELEDLPMLEEQQRNIGNCSLSAVKLGWLPGDAAGARARKILQEKIDDEQRSLAQAEAIRSPALKSLALNKKG